MKLGVWNSKRTRLILDAWKLNNIEYLRKVFLDARYQRALAKKTILSIIDEALPEDSAERNVRRGKE